MSDRLKKVVHFLWGGVYYVLMKKRSFGGGPIIEKTNKQIGKSQ
jgi:hypothetical protein